MVVPDQLVIVELDRDLARDPQGTRLGELRARLAAGAERCRAALDAGVAPIEAQRLRALLAAYGAGMELLPRLWHIQQERI